MAANGRQSPFLDARGFLAKTIEATADQGSVYAARPPFLSVYESASLRRGRSAYKDDIVCKLARLLLPLDGTEGGSRDDFVYCQGGCYENSR